MTPIEHAARRVVPLVQAAKLSALAALVGLGCGIASTLFLSLLSSATSLRIQNQWLIFALPLGGLVVGGLYARFAGSAVRGINLVLDAIHSAEQRPAAASAESAAILRSQGVVSEAGVSDQAIVVPRRMLPLILIGSVITHLVGGSAGREGTAVQMGASLAESVARALHIEGRERRILLLAGVSGGFASVFGTPAAGVMFALEAPTRGRFQLDAMLPYLLAAVVGDVTARALGIHHMNTLALAPTMPELDPLLLIRITVAAVIFGLCARAFVAAVEAVKHIARRIPSLAVRAAVGGGVVLALALLLNTTDYLGLSLPLIENSFTPGGVPASAFALKLGFTAITLGSGFVGGEVTPLFVIGATLGNALAVPLGVAPALLAALGFVSVFAGATKTPLTCTLMGIELFGAGVSGSGAIYLLIGCAVAYFVSGTSGVYTAQRT